MQLIFSYKKLQLYLLGKTLFKFTNIIRMIHDFNGIQKMFVSPYCLLYIFFFSKISSIGANQKGCHFGSLLLVGAFAKIVLA